jgi:serine/threonine protein kinase
MSFDSLTTASPAVIVGRYRVVTLIAHGGMGSLYLAHDPALDRRIAIKLLQKAFDDEAARERFAREARAAGRLRHPNIVTVFDVGEHDSRPFIAMEYVPGETLDQLIRRRTPLSIANRLLILEDLCAGLQFAHTQGIVHRDIKPANVILDVAGTIKILDFGLAHAPDSGITKAGDQLGTLNYMSPEQVVGAHLDHRSDIYAVGALAYELMSQERAFPGTVRDGTMYRILNAQPTPLQTLVPDLDPEIQRIIERAMQKEADQRYQNLDDMREDFAGVRRRLESSEATATLDVDARQAVESREADGVQPLTPTPARHSRVRALAGVARDSTPLMRQDVSSSAATFATGSDREPIAGNGSPRRDKRRLAVIGAITAAFSASLALALYRNAPLDRSVTSPRADQTTPAVGTVPAAPPTAPTSVRTSDGGGPNDRGTDQRPDTIRATGRPQVAERQQTQWLDQASRAPIQREAPPTGTTPVLEPAASVATPETSTAAAERQSPAAPPTSPVLSDKPPPQALPSKPMGAEPSGDTARDSRTSDVAAIQDALNRYADAYRNRDVAAVRKVLPSLSPQQLRGLDKDFSEYRSYRVEIGEPRISIDHDTAIATCQVTRSFVTRSGVGGGHTLATTFHLRKVDASWVIERLESR